VLPGPLEPLASSFLFQVSIVDKELLKFLKLEELILSANQIKEVDAANLPPTLKVQEFLLHLGSLSQCPQTAFP
jgi:hypothetical protein